MLGIRDLSIRSKTMLIIMLASGVAVTLACVGFLSYEYVNHRQALVDNLATLSGIISISSTPAVAFGDTVAVRETLAPLSAEQDVVAACAYTAEGAVLAYYVTPELAAVFDPPPPGPDGHRFADGYLHMYKPIEMEKERVGTLYLRADTQAVRERLVRYGGIVGAILVTSVLVAFGLSSWLQRLISRPIMRLAQVAHRVSLRQDYSLRVAKQGKDEIGRLIEYFNEMLAQIQRRDAELEVHRAHLEDEVVARTRINEELREAKERAEAADEAKGAFLASMSHEIRTPMNGIIGMTEVTLATELTSDQRTYLNMVLASAGSLMTMINEILDLSKLEAGRLELESVPFSLREILAEVIHAQGRPAYDKRLELLCWIPPDVPDLVIGDPARMRQILVNLLGNAIKFTESGHVALAVAADDPRMDPVDLTFRVRDTGVGIPADKQEKIFESFTQVDASLTRRYGGTGLGLAICKRLVKMMGGEISVESELGQGSEFRCTIPFRAPEQQPVSLCHTLRPVLAGKTGLVVTGDQALRDTVVATLAAVGMQPSAAEDETEAWDVVRGARSRGAPFALILSDQRSLDPRESFLLEQLRLRAGGTESAVVLLPPCATTSSVSKYRRYRKATCLIRPFVPDDLVCAVADSLAVNVPESAGTAPRAAAERQAA